MASPALGEPGHEHSLAEGIGGDLEIVSRNGSIPDPRLEGALKSHLDLGLHEIREKPDLQGICPKRVKHSRNVVLGIPYDGWNPKEMDLLGGLCPCLFGGHGEGQSWDFMDATG